MEYNPFTMVLLYRFIINPLKGGIVLKQGKPFRSVLFFSVCFVIILVSTLLASCIESDFGRVTVKQIKIPIVTNNRISTYIPAKLYIPENVTASNPAPAVLLLHGYQNDKDTSAAYALELARRGIVALSMDEFGHGESPVGMRNKGYDLSKSGPNRFKMFMSFTILNQNGTAFFCRGLRACSGQVHRTCKKLAEHGSGQYSVQRPALSVCYTIGAWAVSVSGEYL